MLGGPISGLVRDCGTVWMGWGFGCAGYRLCVYCGFLIYFGGGGRVEMGLKRGGRALLFRTL